MACIYIFRFWGPDKLPKQLLFALAALGVVASLLSAMLSILHIPANGLLVLATLVILLAFAPLSLLLAGHPHALRIGAISLGILIFFILSRLVFPIGNGAALAGLLALSLLVICIFQLYLFHQQGNKSLSGNRFTNLLAAWGLFLISGLFLIADLAALSLLGTAAGLWIAASMVSNSQLHDFRYYLKARRFKRFLQRLWGASAYNPSHVLRQFSLGISNITSPELLATVSIGLISEAVELKRGYLFSVERESALTGDSYRLQGEGGMGHLRDELKTAILSSASPAVRYFLHEHQPILFEDLQSLPDIAASAKAELQWFSALEMQIFAPVHTKEQWIGLLCLGPKASGATYKENDIELIGTLSDQLSLALQNARLIDSLMRVNNDFRRAYTAMEQSNRQLQQAVNQLEKIDQTKTDFISVASHELRTPLTLIRGYTEILLEEKSIQENEFQSKTVAGIYNGIMRQQEILESMLDVASLDASTFSLHKQAVSISHLVSLIHKKLIPALEERNLKLFIENLSSLPVIEADGTALSKVFSNLITNAIKYTPDGGTITISGVQVSPGQLGLPEGGIEIIIADTGIGIDRENLDLIFKKFYQTGHISLHSSGKTKYRGSGPGLGLAIAKGIVEAHGGRIWAESKGFDEETFPGSQFHVVLPLAKHDDAVL